MSFKAIIGKVRDHPSIWQIKHPEYNHKSVREAFWKRVAKELKADEQFIKKRWKSLIDMYRKEYRKVQKGNSKGEGTSYWQYYDSLSFLESEMSQREDRRGQNKIDDQNESDDEDAPLIPAAVWKEEAVIPSPSLLASHMDWAGNVLQEPIVQISHAHDSYPQTSQQSTSRRRQSKTASTARVDLILKRLNSLSTAVGKLSRSEQFRKDEDYMFLMSILPMMRSLSPVRKLQLRGKINECLLMTLSNAQDPLNNGTDYM